MRAPISSRCKRRSPLASATEQASVAVSMASSFMPCLEQDSCHAPNEGRGLVDATAARHGRQAAEKDPAVALGGQPGIAQYQHAAVAGVPDQAPRTLFERQHRGRNLQLGKWISAC